MPTLKATPDWLRADAKGNPIGVDREKNAIMGMVIAQEGPFRSAGRGEFDVAALKKIVTLANRVPRGLRSNFAHASLSADGIGKHLGRIKNARLDSVRVMRNGEMTLLHAVRGDLFFNPTALDTPPQGGKPLGIYVMELAETDPDAISSSVVIQADQELRMDPKTKRPLLDEQGNERPPLWKPVALHGSDIVAVGDAVDGLLSAGLSIDGLPDEVVRKGSQLLDQQFAGQSREVIRARATSWLERYLSLKFGDETESLAPEASLSDVEVGDEVQWLAAESSDLSAELLWGTVEAVAQGGESVGIDGTDLTLGGPAARVACDSDDDGDADCWYLVALDKLSPYGGTEMDEEEAPMAAKPEVKQASAGLSKSVAQLRTTLAERKALG